ncbi:MAG: hypothetical protein FGM25_13600 [Mycobacterium sp.]|nr:hypothetical protein [Mycobacterium sp.]
MTIRKTQVLTAVAAVALLLLSVACSGGQKAETTDQQASDSANAAAELTQLYAGPGVMLRGPENCVGLDTADPWSDPAVLKFCAVKDVFGALGGPSSGAPPADFVEAKGRLEFSQPEDCDKVGPVADGKHDNCAVTSGAVTLLRKGLPVRLFGVCGKAEPKDCAVLGTISDPDWAPDGVYLLMDPAKVAVKCQYAQDASRNGCNAEGFTAGQPRPSCSADPGDPMCEFGPDQRDQMLAAYVGYCTKDAVNCLENQLESQWGPESIIAVGYVNRRDQSNDCVNARRKAEKFTDAVNAKWSTNLPLVQVYLDVSKDQVAFHDSAEGCEFVS